MSAAPHFTLGSFVARWLGALFLVFGTYNPSGRSYVHWAFQLTVDNLALKIIAGLSLSVIYIVLYRYIRDLVSGYLLLVLVALSFMLAGFLGWLLIVVGLADGWAFSTYGALFLFSLATYISLAITYPHVSHRLLGVAHVKTL
jgi:hypothetical protein